MSNNDKESELAKALEYLAQLEKDVQEQYHLSRNDVQQLYKRYSDAYYEVEVARQSQFNKFIDALNGVSDYSHNLDSHAAPIIRKFVESILNQSIMLLREGPPDQEISDIMDRFVDPFEGGA
jgi:hypothetical protein